MSIFRRRRRQRPDEDAPPTTAELRAQREAQWAAAFPGPSAADDYRRTFLRFSPLYWELVQSTQRELLALLIDRVPAELGVPAIFALTALYANHRKPDDAARATLAIITGEIPPAHARTLLVALADAWHNAERQPYDARTTVVTAEFTQALRRLESTSAESSGAISAIREQIEFSQAPDED